MVGKWNVAIATLRYFRWNVSDVRLLHSVCMCFLPKVPGLQHTVNESRCNSKCVSSNLTVASVSSRILWTNVVSSVYLFFSMHMFVLYCVFVLLKEKRHFLHKSMLYPGHRHGWCFVFELIYLCTVHTSFILCFHSALGLYVSPHTEIKMKMIWDLFRLPGKIYSVENINVGNSTSLISVMNRFI